MLKYNGKGIVFGEIPDECTLAFSISNCPYRCKGCHSPHLWDDSGEPLTIQVVLDAIKEHPYTTCILFMGGDSDLEELNQLILAVHSNNLDKKFAWYSGRSEYPESLDANLLDYVKLGPYIEELGPLNSPTTNQRLYYRDRRYKLIDAYPPNGDWMDITNKFLKND